MKSVKIKKEPLMRLFAYLPPYKFYIFLALIAMVAAAAGSSLMALLMGKLTDLGFYQKNGLVAIWAPIALIGISVLHGGGQFCSSYILQKVSQEILVKLRSLMFDHMIRWPEEVVQSQESGRVVSRFVNEASQALSGASQVLTVLVRDSLQVAALLCVLFCGLGKVVSGPEWYFALTISSKEHKNYQLGSRVNLAFAGGGTAQGTVVRTELSDDGSAMMLVIRGDTVTEDTVSRRAATVRLSSENYTGVRFDKEYLRIVDGVKGVYVDNGYPLIIASQTIPTTALAPLFVLWFGYSIWGKVLVTVLITFFPITITVFDGFQSVKTEMEELLFTFGASPAQIFWKLKVPAVLPYFFSAIKMAVPLSIIGAAIGEWLGAQNGLGYFSRRMMTQLDGAGVFAPILLLSVVAMIFVWLVTLLEKKMIRWRNDL